jgi:hypothetical protein
VPADNALHVLLLLLVRARCACGSFAGGRSAWERHLGSRCKKFTKHVVIDSLEMQLKVGVGTGLSAARLFVCLLRSAVQQPAAVWPSLETHCHAH